MFSVTITRCCLKGTVNRREHVGAVSRVLSIDRIASVLSGHRDTMEKVQKRDTKMIEGLEGYSDLGRLRI